jgi:hypothetical protein
MQSRNSSAALWAFIVAIGSIGALALTIVAAQAISPQVKSACKQDYLLHCNGHPVGSASLRQCMRAVGEGLSTPCLVALVNDGEITKEEIERYNNKQAQGKKSASGTKPSATKKSNSKTKSSSKTKPTKQKSAKEKSAKEKTNAEPPENKTATKGNDGAKVAGWSKSENKEQGLEEIIMDEIDVTYDKPFTDGFGKGD